VKVYVEEDELWPDYHVSNTPWIRGDEPVDLDDTVVERYVEAQMVFFEAREEFARAYHEAFEHRAVD
jgi:hypothetical protein